MGCRDVSKSFRHQFFNSWNLLSIQSFNHSGPAERHDFKMSKCVLKVLLGFWCNCEIMRHKSLCQQLTNLMWFQTIVSIQHCLHHSFFLEDFPYLYSWEGIWVDYCWHGDHQRLIQKKIGEGFGFGGFYWFLEYFYAFLGSFTMFYPQINSIWVLNTEAP